MSAIARKCAKQVARSLRLGAGIVWLAVVLYPLVFLVLNSLKTRQGFFAGSVWALPHEFAIENYVAVLEQGFFRFFFNSLIVVGASLVLVVVLGAAVAYAVSRIRFRGSWAIYLVFIAGLTIPVHVTLVPVYVITRELGIYDTLWALIGPYVGLNLPVTIFIIAAFMRDIPTSFDEAAFIDGASDRHVFWWILMPMTRPAITAVGILNAVVMWNEFIFPLVLISSVENRPLTLALWNFQGQFSINIPLMMASLVLTMLPILVAYGFTRERLIEGIVVGALKQ